MSKHTAPRAGLCRQSLARSRMRISRRKPSSLGGRPRASAKSQKGPKPFCCMSSPRLLPLFYLSRQAIAFRRHSRCRRQSWFHLQCCGISLSFLSFGPLSARPRPPFWLPADLSVPNRLVCPCLQLCRAPRGSAQKHARLGARRAALHAMPACHPPDTQCTVCEATICSSCAVGLGRAVRCSNGQRELARHARADASRKPRPRYSQVCAAATKRHPDSSFSGHCKRKRQSRERCAAEILHAFDGTRCS